MGDLSKTITCFQPESRSVIQVFYRMMKAMHRTQHVQVYTLQVNEVTAYEEIR